MHLELISREPAKNPHPTPLLFLHGAGQAAWCWEEYFLPYFAEHGYSAHAMSLRGHGGSDPCKIRWQPLKNYLSDVEQIAAGFATPPIIIGHSTGGYIAVKYLEKHPAPAAILLAPIPPKWSVLPFSFRFSRRHRRLALKAILTFAPYTYYATPELFRELCFSPAFPEDHLLRLFPKLDDESFRIFMDSLLFARPKPRKINTPMLVLGAMDDGFFTPAEIESAAQAYQADFAMFPAMSHNMMLDCGWQQVADRMITWLAELRVKSGN